MENQTFLNLYSLYIQTSGILAALVSVIVFYRIGQITKLLIGQGRAVYKQQSNEILRKDKKDLVPQLYGKYFIRLRDAIDRESILGIEEALIRVTQDECEKISIENRGKNGYFKQALPNWIETTRHLNSLKTQYFAVIILFITIIFLSIISIGILAYCGEFWSILFFSFISILILAVLVLTTKLICLSFIPKIPAEKKKIEKINDLRKDFPEIDKLYYNEMDWLRKLFVKLRKNSSDLFTI